MSELADQISEAIDATTNHVEVIDRIIAESWLSDLLMKIEQVADLDSAKELGDAEERLATIAQMIKQQRDGAKT